MSLIRGTWYGAGREESRVMSPLCGRECDQKWTRVKSFIQALNWIVVRFVFRRASRCLRRRFVWLAPEKKNWKRNKQEYQFPAPNHMMEQSQHSWNQNGHQSTQTFSVFRHVFFITPTSLSVFIQLSNAASLPTAAARVETVAAARTRWS